MNDVSFEFVAVLVVVVWLIGFAIGYVCGRYGKYSQACNDSVKISSLDEKLDALKRNFDESTLGCYDSDFVPLTIDNEVD